MEMPTLDAKPRAQRGSREAARLRGEGQVPAVLYGRGKDVVALEIRAIPLLKLLKSEHQMVNLTLEGVSCPALVREVQYHPLTGNLLHVDFARVELGAAVRVKVKVVLKGIPVGVSANKGVLEHQTHEVEVECLPTAIPEQIVAKVDHLEIGKAVHVKELAAPAGVKFVTDAERIVATVHAPKTEEQIVAEAPVEAAIQPEVIGAKEREARAAAKASEKGEKGEKPGGEKPEAKQEAASAKPAKKEAK